MQLANTADGVDPFFSPDGRYLGFCGTRALETIDLEDGSLVKVSEGHTCWGGSWNEDGTILFASEATIHRIAAAGGPSSEILRPSPPVVSYSDPVFLPDGRHFLVFGDTTKRDTGVYLGDVQARQATFLFESSNMTRYAAPGFLVYLRKGQLFARAFDVNTLKLSDRETVMARLATAIGVSDTGVLAYLDYPRNSELVWMSRNGQPLGRVGSPKPYEFPRLSPDGARAPPTA